MTSLFILEQGFGHAPLVFSGRETQKTITVRIYKDNVSEWSEYFDIVLDNLGGLGWGVAITDNQGRGTIY